MTVSNNFQNCVLLFSCQHWGRGESFDNPNRFVGDVGLAMPDDGLRDLQVEERSCHQSQEDPRKEGTSGQRNQHCFGEKVV